MHKNQINLKKTKKNYNLPKKYIVFFNFKIFVADDLSNIKLFKFLRNLKNAKYVQTKIYIFEK